MLLVIAMEKLLSPRINKNELDVVHKILLKFVEEMEILYPERSMLSGVHELVHLVKCTQNFGPLNYCNCFEFEELNRKLLTLIKGNDLIGEEFIKLFSLAKALSAYSSKINCSKLKKFINENAALKTSIIGKTRIIKDETVSKLVQEFDGSLIEDLVVSYSVEFNGVKYTTTSKETKFCDYCISTNENDFGFIKYFIKTDKFVLVLCQRIVKINEPFFYEKTFKNNKSELFICDA